MNLMHDNNVDGSHTTSPAAPAESEVIVNSQGSAWDVIEDACNNRVTGELSLVLASQAKLRVYMTNGLVYFAERDIDETLSTRLVLAGSLNLDQLHRGSIRLNDVEHLGRLFERDATIDRGAVELAIELITEQTLTDIAEQPVHAYSIAMYRHHPSGIARWFSSQHSIEDEFNDDQHVDQRLPVAEVHTLYPQAQPVAPAPTEARELSPDPIALTVDPMEPAAISPAEPSIVGEVAVAPDHEPAAPIAPPALQPLTSLQQLTSLQPLTSLRPLTALQPMTALQPLVQALPDPPATPSSDAAFTQFDVTPLYARSATPAAPIASEDLAVSEAETIEDSLAIVDLEAEHATPVEVDPSDESVTDTNDAETPTELSVETMSIWNADASPITSNGVADTSLAEPSVETMSIWAVDATPIANTNGVTDMSPVEEMSTWAPDAAPIESTNGVADTSPVEEMSTWTIGAETAHTEGVIEPDRRDDVPWAWTVDARPLDVDDTSTDANLAEAPDETMSTWTVDASPTDTDESDPTEIIELVEPDLGAAPDMSVADVLLDWEPDSARHHDDALAVEASEDDANMAPVALYVPALTPIDESAATFYTPPVEPPAMEALDSDDRVDDEVSSADDIHVDSDLLANETVDHDMVDNVVVDTDMDLATAEIEPSSPLSQPDEPVRATSPWDAPADLPAVDAASAPPIPSLPVFSAPPVMKISAASAPPRTLPTASSGVGAQLRFDPSLPRLEGTPAPPPEPIVEPAPTEPAPVEHALEPVAFLDEVPEQTDARDAQPATPTLNGLTSLSSLQPLHSLQPLDALRPLNPVAPAPPIAARADETATTAATAELTSMFPFRPANPAPASVAMAEPSEYASIPVPEDVAAAVRRAIIAIEAATLAPTGPAPVTFGPMHVTAPGQPLPYAPATNHVPSAAVGPAPHSMQAMQPLQAMQPTQPIQAVQAADGTVQPLMSFGNGESAAPLAANGGMGMLDPAILAALGPMPEELKSNVEAAPISTERKGALRRLIDGIRRRKD